MDVQSVSTGRRYFRIDDAIGMILTDAGIVCPLHILQQKENPAVPAPPTQPVFSVVQRMNSDGSQMLCIQLELPSGEKTWFNGQPKDAAAAFRPHPVPKAIVAEYELLFGPVADPLAVREAREQQLARAQAAQEEQSKARGY